MGLPLKSRFFNLLRFRNRRGTNSMIELSAKLSVFSSQREKWHDLILLITLLAPSPFNQIFFLFAGIIHGVGENINLIGDFNVSRLRKIQKCNNKDFFIQANISLSLMYQCLVVSKSNQTIFPTPISAYIYYIGDRYLLADS